MQNETALKLPKLRSTKHLQPQNRSLSHHADLTSPGPTSAGPTFVGQSHHKIVPVRMDTQGAAMKESRSKSSAHGLNGGGAHSHFKYIAKSPEYFKRKERSMQSLEAGYAQDEGPVEKYIGAKMRDFDKSTLIGLAREGLYPKHNTKSSVKDIGHS